MTTAELARILRAGSDAILSASEEPANALSNALWAMSKEADKITQEKGE